MRVAGAVRRGEKGRRGDSGEEQVGGGRLGSTPGFLVAALGMGIEQPRPGLAPRGQGGRADWMQGKGSLIDLPVVEVSFCFMPFLVTWHANGSSVSLEFCSRDAKMMGARVRVRWGLKQIYFVGGLQGNI